jgi:hypothetical protein
MAARYGQAFGPRSGETVTVDDVAGRRRPAADALKDWGLAHRFAGSGDRAAIARPASPRNRHACAGMAARYGQAFGPRSGETVTVHPGRRRPAADALKDWGLAHRFAGSGDRAAIASLVYGRGPNP